MLYPLICKIRLQKSFALKADNVASFLAFGIEANLRQRFDAFPPRDAGQLAHTATITASKRSSGIGKPSSCKAVI